MSQDASDDLEGDFVQTATVGRVAGALGPVTESGAGPARGTPAEALRLAAAAVT